MKGAALFNATAGTVAAVLALVVFPVALAYRYSQRPVGGTNPNGVRWRISRGGAAIGKGEARWFVERLVGGSWLHAGAYDKRQDAIGAAQLLKGPEGR